jgi:hypothetical protein
MGHSDKKTGWIHPDFANSIGRRVPEDGWAEPATRLSNPSSPNLHIAPIRPLKPVSQIPEWLESGAVPIPFLDGEKLHFTLRDLTEEDEAKIETPVSAFLRLGPKARLAISYHVFGKGQGLLAWTFHRHGLS